MSETKAAANTDRELYREPGDWRGDFYSDSIHVAESGAIGINCGGSVVVRPLRFFHAAPDLYEALGALMPAIEYIRLNHGTYAPSEAKIAAARTALANATDCEAVRTPQAPAVEGEPS